MSLIGNQHDIDDVVEEIISKFKDNLEKEIESILTDIEGVKEIAKESIETNKLLIEELQGLTRELYRVRSETDNVILFSTDSLISTGDPKDKIPLFEIYKTYTDYCITHRYTAKSKQTFRKSMEALNHTFIVGGKNVRAFTGLQFKDDDWED